MHIIKKNKVFKLFLVFIMAISLNSKYLIDSNIEAVSDVTFQEKVTYPSQNEAIITFEGIQENAIINIENPDGSFMNLEHPQYQVTNNGEYLFKVYQQDTMFEKRVVVDQLTPTSFAGLEHMATLMGIVPSSIESGDGAQLEIVDYDYASGMNNALTYTVRATADFGDDVTSTGKSMTFTLPEGLRFVQIPVAGTYSTTGVDTSLIAQLQAGDPLATAIQSVELPKKETNTIASTYGAITYNFVPGTKSATVEFKVMVDNKRYYKAMDIPTPMNVDTKMNGVPLGHVEAKIFATGKVLGAGTLRIYTTTSTTKEALASTPGEVSLGKVNGMSMVLYDASVILDTSNRFYKSATFYAYYPEGMEFDSLIGKPTSATFVNDPANSRIIMSVPTWGSNFTYQVQYKIPEGTALGTYTNPANDYVEYEFYDGTKQIFTDAAARYSVNIVAAAANTMDISYYGDAYYDDTVADNMNVYGPFFQIKNITAGIKKNQRVEFVFGSNWHPRAVLIPFDSSIAGNTLTNVKYKTNKNSEWRTTTAISNSNTLLKLIRADVVGLDTDEWFTELQADVGSFSTSYASSNQSSPKGSTSVSSYGQLAKGTVSDTVKVSIYDIDDEANTKSSYTGKVINSGLLTRTLASQSTVTFKNIDNTTTSQVVAGDRFKVAAQIKVHAYQYGTSTGLHAPEIYLRAPLGTTIAVDTLQLTDQSGKPLTNWSYTIHTNALGEEMYVIKTSEDTNIGAYFDMFTIQYINVNYELATSIKTKGSFNANELVGWGKPGILASTYYGGTLSPVVDVYDFDGDGNTTESILSVQSNTINVLENTNVLVETFLSLSGEEAKAPYVDGNDASVAFFTPGTQADYTLNISNNGKGPANAFSMFVPIPKTGKSFGSIFQDKAFMWDMSLSSEVILDSDLQTKFDVLYSIDATAANYNTTATYVPFNQVNINDVVMVKIVAKIPVPAGDESSIKIPLRVNETFDSATLGNKIGTRNIYNPVYDVDSTSFSGTLKATRVGSELVIAEIGGTVFVDTNADGLFNVGDGDVVVVNHEVELYKWNDTTKKYEAVLDANNQPVKTVSDENGVYLFDYTMGVGYGKYAIRFVEKSGGVYQYTVHNPVDRSTDSDAIIANDIPNVGDLYRGWVLDIDATKPVAKTLGAGFLAYNPPVDLKVRIQDTPNIVKVGSSITVGSIVEPEFWDTIKHPTNPYTWTIVGGASEQAKATLQNNQNGSVIITPNALASGTTTMQIMLEIKDVYGNTKQSLPATITIVSNTPPTILAEMLTKYVDDTFDVLEGVSAKDNTQTPILLNATAGLLQNTFITNDIPVNNAKYTTPGTYEVTYKVQDFYKNEAQITRIIQVNGLPTIDAKAQTYSISETNIAEQVGLAANASYEQAQTSVGSTPLVVNIDTTYSVVSGPSSDFSVAGIYTVSYTATNVDNKTVTKTVEVLVKGEDAKSDPTSTLTIDANDFTIAHEDVAALSASVTKDTTHASTVAYYLQDATTFKDVTSNIQVNTSELSAIQTAPKAGGVYPLTFTSTENGITVSKTIQVTVKMATDALNVDLGAPRSVKVGDSITITPTITPDYWEAIQDATTPYTWSLVDANDANYVTLTNTDQASVQVSGIQKLVGRNVTLQLTIQDRDGRTATASVEVQVNTNAAPTITSTKQVVYVNDRVDLLKDVVASDDDGNAIVLIPGVLGNVEIQTSVPQLDSQYTTPGTYAVTYKVTDKYGNIGEQTTTIEVNGLPTIEAKAQVYKLNDTNIMFNVSKQVKASWLKANETLGDATAVDIAGPANETKAVNTISYEVISGPSGVLDFSKSGVYEVKYTASNPDGKESTKIVPVIVLEANSASETTDTLYLSANSFILENKEASQLNLEQAKTYASVSAYEVVRNENKEITSFIEVNKQVQVYEEQLQAIQSVNKQGGVFELTFNLVMDGKEVTKKVHVVVKGDGVKPTPLPNGKILVITASDFELTNAQAKQLTEASTFGKANAKTYLLDDEESQAVASLYSIDTDLDTVKVAVESTQVEAIKQVATSGGTYPLTFTAIYTDQDGKQVQNEITIQVKVKAVESSNAIDTGDTTQMMNYMYLLIIAILVFGVYGTLRKRSK